MFVQVIQGQTNDAEGVHRLIDRWVTELGPSAPGWMGTTAGVTDDGQLFAAVRFDSEENANRNSERDEQGAWYAEFVKHLDSEPTFHNCREAETFLKGGSDDAGFVQVIQSKVLDADRVREMGKTMDSIQSEGYRPDLIGGIAALHDDDGRMTQFAYFTSEAEAREGEKSEAPPAVREAMAGMSEVVTDEQYFDLRDPWLASPS